LSQLPVGLRCETARGRTLSRAIRSDAVRTLRLLGLQHSELSVVIVNDRAIRRLNHDYRGKDEPTDVLSFPHFKAVGKEPWALRLGAPPADAISGPPLALGDVVISVETACRQARTLGESPAARMRTLLLHGTLHLLGYDHERSEEEAHRMFARERELASHLAGVARRPKTLKLDAAGCESSPAAMPPRNRLRSGKRVRSGSRP